MADRSSLPPIDNSMGAILIGVLVSGALWGIGVAQLYYYLSEYGDATRIQAMVVASFVLDTMHQILLSHAVYTYLITWYRDPSNLEKVVWSLVAQIMFSAINALLVQCFFTWRVWILGGKRVVYIVPLVSLTAASFAVNVAYFSRATFIHWSFTNIDKLKPLSLSINIVGVASDVAIAIGLVLLLRRSKSGFSSSNRVVHRLMILFMTTGLGTSICALFSLITISIWPDKLIFIAFYVPLSQLYTNSLLATLNARKTLQSALPSELAMRAYPFDSAIASPNGAQHVAIHVTSDIVVDHAPSTPSTQRAGNLYELSVFDRKDDLP